MHVCCLSPRLTSLSIDALLYAWRPWHLCLWKTGFVIWSLCCELRRLPPGLSQFLHIGNIPKLKSLPKSHARIEVIALDIIGCKKIIYLCQENHVTSFPFVICRLKIFKSIFPSISGGRWVALETTSYLVSQVPQRTSDWVGLQDLIYFPLIGLLSMVSSCIIQYYNTLTPYWLEWFMMATHL